MRVVVVEPGNLPSTRLVLTQILEELKNEGVLDCQLTRERDGNLSTFQGADIAILFRCSELQTVILAKLAARNGATVMYATDDNLLEVPKETRDGAYFQSIPVRWVITRLIKMADAILVYSGFAQDYFSKMNSHVALLEPLPATYANDYSGKVDRSSSETVVGYAGTASHAADFEPLVPAIRKLLETPNLRFDFIGYCPPELLGMEHVRLTPWIDRYEDYLAALTLRRWDIGLAPLKDTLFNNCKTNLKFREYAALGIAGIYSDIPLYRGCVRDGENGLLVSNTAEAWHRGIQKLAGDTKLRSRIRAASEEEAKTKYTVEKSARELMKLVQALSAGESKPANVHLPRPWVFLYALARPFGIALAVFIQLVASIRHRTFWKEVLEIRRKRSSHLTEG